jgi:hypothetical protein
MDISVHLADATCVISIDVESGNQLVPDASRVVIDMVSAVTPIESGAATTTVATRYNATRFTDCNGPGGMMLTLAWQEHFTAETGPMMHALPAELPSPLIERLRAEGVATLEAWVALGRRRREIFGVTRTAVAQLDSLAKAIRKPSR